MVKPLTANQELEYLKWQDDKRKQSTCDIVRWCARVIIIVKVIFIDKLLFIVYIIVCTVLYHLGFIPYFYTTVT